MDNCNFTPIEMIDLRSDTITKPCSNMLEAMFKANVGDDVYGEDPTVKQLEKKYVIFLEQKCQCFSLWNHGKSNSDQITHLAR